MKNFRFLDLWAFGHDKVVEKNDIMKLYINADTDSYEVASLFVDDCKKLGIDPVYKVINGSNLGELSRNDKFCIYIQDIKEVQSYLSILEKIKDERPDLKFKKPLISTGDIDNWIGIGCDIPGYGSYNTDILEILKSVIDENFNKNMNNYRSKLPELYLNMLKENPSLLQEIRNNIANKAKEEGRCSEKICILSNDKERFKEIKIPPYEDILYKNNQKSRNLNEILNEPIDDINISKELLEELYRGGYNGTSRSRNIKYSV